MSQPTPPPRARRRLWPANKKLRTSAGFVTVAMVLVVLGAMAFTLLGSGVVSRTLDIYDGNVWLWSSASSSSQRVNTGSGQVDLRHSLKDAQGHDVVVVQTDDHLLLHDRTSGTVTAVDLANLGNKASLAVSQGAGTTVAMWKKIVLLVDVTAGTLQRINPDTLKPQGIPLRLAPNLIPGAFDDHGRYWVASRSDGTVKAVVNETGDGELRIEHSVTVAEPNHELKLTVLNDGAAAVDETSSTVVVIRDGKPERVAVPGLTGVKLATRTTSSTIAISVASSRKVVLLDGTTAKTIGVPGNGELGEAVVFADRVYVNDPLARSIVVLDPKSGAKNGDIQTSGVGPVSLEQREGHLVINEPNSSNGFVVDKKHQVKRVSKYSDQTKNPGTADPMPNATPSNTPGASTSPNQNSSRKPSNGSARPTTPRPPSNPAPSFNPVPTGVRAALVGNQNVRITWNAVSVPAGKQLDRYVLYQCNAGGGMCVRTIGVSGTSVTIPEGYGSVTSGSFRVTSVINGVESELSAASNAVQWR